MVTGRLSAYWSRVRMEFEAAFSEDLPPGDVATSFSFGIFVAALPNLGIALVLFAVLGSVVDRVSRLALLAAIVVMNPPAKWAVYAASYWLGVQLLGPVPGVSVSELSLSIGPAVLLRLVVGNLIIAAVISAIGYVLALRFIGVLRRRDVELVESLAETLPVETK